MKLSLALALTLGTSASLLGVGGEAATAGGPEGVASNDELYRRATGVADPRLDAVAAHEAEEAAD